MLSSLQTVLKYPEIAAQHKAAAQKYGKLRREIEVELTLKSHEPQKLTLLLDKLQQEWDTLEDQSPTIPQRIYDMSAKIETSQSRPDTSLLATTTPKVGK